LYQNKKYGLLFRLNHFVQVHLRAFLYWDTVRVFYEILFVDENSILNSYILVALFWFLKIALKKLKELGKQH
jgi:hypothetical protein